MSDSAPTCPRCGSASVPIVYGLPGYSLFEAYDRGEIAFGGCVIQDDDPAFSCTGLDCGIRFGQRWMTSESDRSSAEHAPER